MVNWINKPKVQDPFITPSKMSIGDEKNRLIFITRSVKQEVASNENDPKTDNYELPIVKYDVNHDVLIK